MSICLFDLAKGLYLLLFLQCLLNRQITKTPIYGIKIIILIVRIQKTRPPHPPKKKKKKEHTWDANKEIDKQGQELNLKLNNSLSRK